MKKVLIVTWHALAVVGIVAIILCATQVTFVTWDRGEELHKLAQEERAKYELDILTPRERYAAWIWNMHNEARRIPELADATRVVVILGGP